MKKTRISIVLFLGIGLIWGLACCSSWEAEVKFEGINMEPTIMAGQVCTVQSRTYYTSDPKRGHIERGDIVFISSNAGPSLNRVIGLPGETITIEDGAVYIDGTILDEPYLPDDTITESDTKEFRVPDNYYFLMGDNRAQSNDSRTGGSVPQSRIKGKLLFCQFR